MTEQIVEYKVCPTCGSEFLVNKSRKKIFCCEGCRKKSYYKPITKTQNPLGVIQGITINYTEHIDVERDKLFWFTSLEKIGNVNLKVLRERNFRVSDILLHNGYDIQDPEEFDREFKKLIKRYSLVFSFFI